jgi:Hint domain
MGNPFAAHNQFNAVGPVSASLIGLLCSTIVARADDVYTWNLQYASAPANLTYSSTNVGTDDFTIGAPDPDYSGGSQTGYSGYIAPPNAATETDTQTSDSSSSQAKNNESVSSAPLIAVTGITISSANASVVNVVTTSNVPAAQTAAPATESLDAADTGQSSANCFFKGTRIRTPYGEIQVDRLAIGDEVVTLEGAHLRVKSIGHQLCKEPAMGEWSETVIPVRIARGALGENVPRADLYVSPGHALFMDGALIPAHFLVNGRSIVREIPEGAKDIEYFHIELETHEIIFAEGAQVESFLVKDEAPAVMDGSDSIAQMMPRAPVWAYHGGREEMSAMFRRALSAFIDVRDPIQKAYDRGVARANAMNNRADPRVLRAA